jgi:hypothetical protein
MRKVTTRTAALVLLLGGAGTAGAAPLNPDDYSSLGALATAAGAYTINTSGTPTLSGPGVNLSGVIVGGVAVFDFDSISIGAGSTIVATGALPLALLSRQGLSVGGSIDVSAPLFSPGVGGAGATNVGVGGAGQVVQTDYYPYGPYQPYTISGGYGGGGFGGQGGAGGDRRFYNFGSGSNFAAHGGLGGGSYGDLSAHLQGGSAGGGGVFGGGGAIELGAIGVISITGKVMANGAGDLFGSTSNDPYGGSGGGSGGGILIHGGTVTLDGLLSAVGGNGAPSPSGAYVPAIGAGGGGGGGLILIETTPGGFTGSGSFDVSGGVGGQAGRYIIDPQGPPAGGDTIVAAEAPEPASVAMLGAGLAGVLVLARRSGRSKAA